MNAEQYLERIENKRLNGTPLYSRKEMIDFAEKYVKQLNLSGVSCSASDVISKIKNLPESDFSQDGQLKLLRVCGNALGLYKAVKWMQKQHLIIENRKLWQKE